MKALGIDEFRKQVEAEWLHIKDNPNTITEAELARLYAVKEALTNLPVRIMLVGVLKGIQSNDQHNTKDEEELESLQALIRADIALINECLR